jgi:glycosyltransferase involved in cell wall biosynthesis
LPELLREAANACADLYVAHSEQGLWAAEQLRLRGYRVGVDIEDWFSEDLLPEARRSRPTQMLRGLERAILDRGAYATCPSAAMSKALAREFGSAPPAVIYNAFRWSDRASLDGKFKDRRDRRHLSIHWYSQTLGAGRGIEDLLGALRDLNYPVEIHLRGNMAAGFDKWLESQIPDAWRDRVFVHDLVSNSELLSRIAEHDIGFAGEMKYCLNRELTVTNKVLHYLLAGLAVVASDTAGQQEVSIRAPGAMMLYPSGDARALASKLNSLLEFPDVLLRAKAAAIAAAKLTFCWERQEPHLLNAVARAIEAPARPALE